MESPEQLVQPQLDVKAALLVGQYREKSTQLALRRIGLLTILAIDWPLVFLTHTPTHAKD